MLKIVPSNKFKKDLKLAFKRGLNLALLREVVNTLAEQKPLDQKYRDHELSGNYSGFRECHIQIFFETAAGLFLFYIDTLESGLPVLFSDRGKLCQVKSLIDL